MYPGHHNRTTSMFHVPSMISKMHLQIAQNVNLAIIACLSRIPVKHFVIKYLLTQVAHEYHKTALIILVFTQSVTPDQSLFFRFKKEADKKMTYDTCRAGSGLMTLPVAALVIFGKCSCNALQSCVTITSIDRRLCANAQTTTSKNHIHTLRGLSNTRMQASSTRLSLVYDVWF